MLFFRAWQNHGLFLSLSSNSQPWFKAWLFVFYHKFTKLATRHQCIIFCIGSVGYFTHTLLLLKPRTKDLVIRLVMWMFFCLLFFFFNKKRFFFRISCCKYKYGLCFAVWWLRIVIHRFLIFEFLVSLKQFWGLGGGSCIMLPFRLGTQKQ